VAAIIKQSQNENISVVFVTPQYDISSAETIAEEIGGEVIYANPLMTNYKSTIYKLVLDMISGFEK
jgi:zinc transport system substrate-binding protein